MTDETLTDAQLAAAVELYEAEQQDNLVRTIPVNMDLMVGMATISAQTTKLDNLLKTTRVRESAVLTKALTNLKRDLLVGLTQVQGALK